MRISVVIPAFNNWKLTRRCVDALFATTPADLLAEVVVVDDASTDGESAAWAATRPGIVPLLLDRNRGFSGACNAAAARCRGEAILFLNNDAFARPGALEILREALVAHAGIGIAGARLLYADGSLQHAGLALLPGAASRWWHVHKRRAGDLPDAQIARDLYAVTGAALLIRRELFERLDGFDEGYVNGWEDVDLCLRAWSAGARVRYEPRAVLEHLESATLGHANNHARNERHFIERWRTILAGTARYPLPEVPPVAFAVRPTAPAADAWALAHINRWWNGHLGAAVTRTRPGARLDRARVDVRAALARRRPTLEISWGDACFDPPTGPQRIAYVTPRSADEAARYARSAAVTAWWTTTDVAARALGEAGIAPDAISVVRLGCETAAPSARAGLPVIATTATDADLLDGLKRDIPGLRTVIVDTGARPLLSGVDLLVTRGGGDRYGLLVPAAIGQGCAVVTSPPVDSFAAAAPGVTIVEEPLLLEALRSQVRAIDAVRAAAGDLFLDARRRLDAYLATQLVAEQARATTGGTPSAALVAVDAAIAQRLRDTFAGAPFAG